MLLSSRVQPEEVEQGGVVFLFGFLRVESPPSAASFQDVARSVRYGVEVEVWHTMNPERHARYAVGDDLVLLRVADPCHGRELDVFLCHYPVDHVTDEACCGLVEMGRNPPQKRFELAEQFCSDCGIIHAVISLVCVSTSHYSEDHPGEVTFFFVPPVRELRSARGCPASPQKIGEPPMPCFVHKIGGI